MPSKNTRNRFNEKSFYHVYNRGVNKQDIFLDSNDYIYLYSLLSRYLDPSDNQVDVDKVPYEKFHKSVELQCYCLMNNHYHFLIYCDGVNNEASKLMKNIWGTYTRYFNKKYTRIGPLFQDRFKASLVSSEDHLIYLTKYIHLNPRNYENYRHSSLTAYLNLQIPKWMNPSRCLNITRQMNYREFLETPEQFV